MKRIVCAANAYKNLLIVGPRHFDQIMHKQIQANREALLVKPSAWEQGFIDQYGAFHTREAAFIIAQQAGQIIRRVGGDEGKLYSENLY